MAGQSSARFEKVLVDGHGAVVLGELRNTAKPTGRVYGAAFALHLTAENGLITRHHVYEDSLAVWDAFHAGPPARRPSHSGEPASDVDVTVELGGPHRRRRAG